jgi:hypothetical protein
MGVSPTGVAVNIRGFSARDEANTSINDLDLPVE